MKLIGILKKQKCSIFYLGICFWSIQLVSQPQVEPFPQTRSIAAAKSPDIPDFVVPLSDNYIFGILYKDEKPGWIHFGVQHRNRLQMRDQNYRDTQQRSQLLLLGRTLIYAGLRDVAGPLQFDLELINSRDIGGDAPDSSKNLNFLDLQQAYAHFHFANDETDIPELSIKLGRMSFDFVDRRLIARNRFRNTINNFDGIRVQSTWNDQPLKEFEIFATRPVELHKTGFDKTSNKAYLFGAATTIVPQNDPNLPKLTPYWVHYRHRESGIWGNRYSTGLHFYDDFGQSENGFWDYDAHIVYQFGRDPQNQKIRAWAAHLETGYTFHTQWQPRLAGWINISSGDKNSLDSENNNFDSLFSATYGFYGFTSLFDWDNVINPAIQITVKPNEKLRFQGIFRGYWLQEPSAGWLRTQRFIPAGKSENFIGSELDVRMNYSINKISSLESGAGIFFPGGFTQNSGPSPTATFVYTAITLRL